MLKSVINDLLEVLWVRGISNSSTALETLLLFIYENTRIVEEDDDLIDEFSSLSPFLEFLIEHAESKKLDFIIHNSEDAARIIWDSIIEKGNESSVNSNVANLMQYLLSPSENDLIYMPFGHDLLCGDIFHHCVFDIDIFSYNDYNRSKLFAAVLGLNNCKLACNNPLSHIRKISKMYSKIYLPLMPIGLRQMGRRYEEEYVLSLIDHLAVGGRMVVLLPASFGFDEKYFELRKFLAEKRYLKTAILLPSGVALSKAGISCYILVIEKKFGDEPIHWIHPEASLFRGDCKDILSLPVGSASHATIEYPQLWSDHSLRIRDYSSSKFVLNAPEGFKFVQLKDILASVGSRIELEDTSLVARLDGKCFRQDNCYDELHYNEIRLVEISGKYNAIEESAYCFHSINCVGRPVVIEDGDTVVFNNDVFAFKSTNPNISMEYLSYALNRPDVQEEIQAMKSGNVIRRISKRDFLDIHIPIPDVEYQSLFAQEILRVLKEDKEKRLKSEKDQSSVALKTLMDDIEDKVHLSGPYNMTVQAALSRFCTLLKKGKTLSADTEVFEGMTALNVLLTAQKASKTVGLISASMAQSLMGEADVETDFISFVRDYVNALKCDISFSEISFEFETEDWCMPVAINKAALEYALRSIINNAQRHGLDETDDRITVRFKLTTEEQPNYITLSIANNGKRVSENFSELLYRQKGGKCGPNAKSGRGGALVANVMDHYNGGLQIITDDKDWSFIVKLLIPAVYV